MTRGAAAFAAALLVPALLAAQSAEPPPLARTDARFSMLLSVGGGATPDFDGSAGGGGGAMLTAAGGVRLRASRLAFVDLLIDAQGPFANGDAVALGGPPTTYRLRRFSDRVRRADAFASVQTRAGVQIVPGRYAPTLRMAAGGGYMTEIGRPFASIVSGIGTRGRHLRLAVDAERWWYRLPTHETTYTVVTPTDPGVPWVPPLEATRTGHVARHSTFVRIGIEVPIVAP